MKKSLIILALLTMGSTAYAQVSGGGGVSGSVRTPAVSGQAGGSGSVSGDGGSAGVDIQERDQAQAPAARLNNSNGIHAQDRDKGLDRARDRMNQQGLEHSKAPGTNSR